ncbi:hypothetical protein UN66_16605 [Bacillus cereus]|nr:hypothetical protein UN66_16605 [Bacillus cereus]
MSDNYRSRTERNHVKNQKQETNTEKKPKKKGSFFKKIPYRLSTSWYRWSCSWRFRFLCYGEGCSKIRQIKTCQSFINKVS